MEFQGIDLTDEAGQVNSVSWQKPHPLFVIVLVGAEQTPFGIQKDLLVAKSPFYRHKFSQMAGNQLENIEHLPTTTVEAFGCFQNFIYTGSVYSKSEGHHIPEYIVLLGVWILATMLQMAPLRVAILNAMAERRQETSCIPGTSLIVQAWKETEEGSGLRLMLLNWAAEHMRSSPDSRNEFAKSLPQEILSELVITMATLPLPPARAPPALASAAPSSQKSSIPVPISVELDTEPRPSLKRPRKSAPDDEVFEMKPLKKPTRKSEPARRRTIAPADGWGTINTPEKEIEYCKDLIDRMIRGPGFWTRLVGPFRNPVDPVVEDIPTYFDVVKNPMDLNTIKTKIFAEKYGNGAEFEEDVRLIHRNCYEFWSPGDPMWKSCEDFEKYFNTQWGERWKWAPGSKSHKNSVKSETVE